MDDRCTAHEDLYAEERSEWLEDMAEEEAMRDDSHEEGV